ncbi:selenium cofactor biosynthesis protein YqeC [Natrialbaceae archaeon GCM10025810]|uniref:selenium cofactor biosynthesis protein YqeC n=1 Tax=Halovalidus salilacus TaxID=3075124 RepID=UPI003605D5C7
MDLVRALEADGPLTCVVGAGGKKSTLYELVGRLERTVLTATVRIPIFDRHVSEVRVTADPLAALEALEESGDHEWPLGLVAEREGTDRYVGYEPETVDRIVATDAVDHVLVKADGARTRLLKAPGDHEPRIPPGADTVLALASVRAVGRPLSESDVHRPERVSTVIGREIGEPIEPADVATILTNPEGGLKDVPEGATYVPVLNMVDDEDDREVAETIAAGILESEAASSGRLSRVVLTSMIAEDPLISVVG